MNTLDRTTGNAYANDPAYDALTGYVTHCADVVGITLDGWKVRHTVTVINLGRPDRGAPADPERNMQPEQLTIDNTTIAAAVEGTRRARAARDAALTEALRELLQRIGPSTVSDLAQRLGVGEQRVRELMRATPEHFVFFGGLAARWGLVGHEYRPERRERITAARMAIRDALIEHGPQGTLELARRLGVHQTTVHNCVSKHPTWFVVVEIRKGVGNIPPARIWGVTGIHDQQEAA